MPLNNHEVGMDEYYQQLQDIASHIPHHDIIIVFGHINAQTGRDRSDFEQALGPHAY